MPISIKNNAFYKIWQYLATYSETRWSYRFFGDPSDGQKRIRDFMHLLANLEKNTDGSLDSYTLQRFSKGYCTNTYNELRQIVLKLSNVVRQKEFLEFKEWFCCDITDKHLPLRTIEMTPISSKPADDDLKKIYSPGFAALTRAIR